MTVGKETIKILLKKRLAMLLNKEKKINKKLNICLIAKNVPLTEVAYSHSFILPIMRQIAKRGHSVSLLSWSNSRGKALIQQEGLKVYFLGLLTPKATIADFPKLCYKKFMALHNENPFDIVHSIDNSAVPIALQKSRFKVPIVFDIEATSIPKLLFFSALQKETLRSFFRTNIRLISLLLYSFFVRDRAILSKSNSIFVTSPLQKITLERYFLFPAYHTYLIPYGVKIPTTQNMEKNSDLLKKLNITEDTQTLLTKTDMNEIESIKSLLNAFLQVVIKKKNCHLLIIGLGPFFREVEKEILDLALESHVTLLGQVPTQELTQYISLSDIYISLASHSSGFESSLLAAMFHKVVVIGSQISPIASIIENNKNGFLIKPSDVQTLFKLILEILSDKNMAQSVGENAQRTMDELFNIDEMVKKVLSAYHQTLIKT